MGILPIILSLVFPACGKPGAEGVKPPGLVDFKTLTLPKTPNKALAGPADLGAIATISAPVYPVPALKLYDAVQQVAASEPRSYRLDQYPAQMQAAWVIRSATANFPDIVEAEVIPLDAQSSTLILYSHSIYGASDFGVNAKRVKDWLAQLTTILKDH